MRDQSLDGEDGEFVALLGPSGCGKSTLLQIINGLLMPDTGRVMLDGQDITGRTGGGRGMVFQGSDLLPWRSALDNVAFGLEVAGMPKAERSEEHTSELQSLMRISYAVFCLTKKKTYIHTP